MIIMKYSIIIPAYNCDKSITKTINSIILTKFYDYEIIIVNDGSVDNTKNVIESYIKNNKNNNIKLYNKNNSGVSDTRNFGIDKAKGKYILFVDADDTVGENFFRVINDKVENSDLLIFSFKVIGDSNRENDTNVIQSFQNQSYNKNQLLNSFLKQKNNIFGYIWRCCIKKSLLEKNNINFATGIKLSEDFLFMFECIKYSNDIKITTEEIYNYIINQSSVTSKYIETMEHDLFYINNRILEQLDEKKMINSFKFSIANSYLLILQNTCKNKNNTKQQILTNIKKMRKSKILKDSLKYSIFNFWQLKAKKNISFLFIYLHMEYLYLYLYKIKNK